MKSPKNIVQIWKKQLSSSIWYSIMISANSVQQEWMDGWMDSHFWRQPPVATRRNAVLGTDAAAYLNLSPSHVLPLV